MTLDHGKTMKARRRQESLWRFLVGALSFLLLITFSISVVYHSQLPPINRSPLVQEDESHTLWSNRKKAVQVVKKDKKGNVLHHSITALHKQDLEGLGDDHVDLSHARQGREELLAILEDAGVEDIDAEAIAKLPTWQQVLDLYGPGPVVYGLETCPTFRDTIPLDDASIGTAGLFNTGTNPFAMYLSANCVMPNNTHDKHGGMRWQV